MKILQVCTVPTDKSGIPHVIFNLLDAIQDTKDKPALGYVSINEIPIPFKDKLQKWGVRSFIVPRKMSNPLRYIRQLSKIAREYDVIHVHGNSATMILEMIAAKLAGVKLRIAHSHNTTCSARLIDNLARPLFYNLCNGRLACGQEAGEWLFKYRNFQIVNNGIETSRFQFSQEERANMRKNLKIEDCMVFGHIGNFNEQKNHRFLIDIFTEIVKTNPTSRLLLLGNGHLLQEIQELAKEKGIYEKIIFAGSVNDPYKYMHAMDIILMPSLFEGLPLTMVEEQANGLQILAAATITPESNMSGNVKFLSLTLSPEKWADEAIKLTERSWNREQKSKEAIIQIKNCGYDIHSVASELIAYYKTHTNK